MLFFKVWVEVAQSKGMIELLVTLEKEEKERQEWEAKLAKLLGDAGDSGNALQSLEDQIKAAQAELQQQTAQYKGLGGELRRITKQIDTQKGNLESESALRKEQQDKNDLIRKELAEVQAVHDELSGELMGVAGDVHTVH